MEIPRNLHLVTGDATQIHQLIMNIAVNARDAMPGGGRLTISARNERLDDSYARMHIDARPTQYVVIEIADTGQGMPQAILEKIFDPFFTTKAKGKGTGLGLSTALSIVKGHGGFINAYSEVGHGSSFKVYFPASDGEVEGDENEVGEVLALGNGELILVADDEEPVLEISRQILESYGYEVLTAKDGTEALISYLREQREVALVVVDMMMPHLDGAGTIRALRKINPRLPIVAMGGLLGSGATAAEDQYDANAFLPKPFTAATLLATLRQLLDRGDNAAPTS